eukprot:TRINITY_DN70056_c0_g1_i1.p1 TRINITY_DN70056_c0_g1~~TRINITY_DN70056_c0_g1_i1.p1  ORF type:complete len:461 (+),score=106.60 TRINITY_DN70056_c0_g1_i1:115-1497(+)
MTALSRQPAGELLRAFPLLLLAACLVSGKPGPRGDERDYPWLPPKKQGGGRPNRRARMEALRRQAGPAQRPRPAAARPPAQPHVVSEAVRREWSQQALMERRERALAVMRQLKIPGVADQVDAVLFFRTAGQTSPCAARMVKRMAQLLQGLVNVVVLYDPGPQRPMPQAHNKAVQLYAPVKVITITADEVLNTWPRMRWPLPCLHEDINPTALKVPPMRNLCREMPGKRGVGALRAFRLYAQRKMHTNNLTKLVNFFIHEPSTVLAARRLGMIPSQIWSIEEDTGMGDPTRERLRGFFAKHIETSADFFAVPGTKGPNSMKQDEFKRFYVFQANAEMIKLFPEPWQKWEHVQGFSRRYIHRLGELLDQGAAAHGEFFSGTACAHSAGMWPCIVQDLSETGDVHQLLHCYRGNHSCDPQVARTCASPDPGDSRLCNAQHPEFVGRWLHPIKNWCTFAEYRG